MINQDKSLSIYQHHINEIDQIRGWNEESRQLDSTPMQHQLNSIQQLFDLIEIEQQLCQNAQKERNFYQQQYAQFKADLLQYLQIQEDYQHSTKISLTNTQTKIAQAKSYLQEKDMNKASSKNHPSKKKS